MKKAALSLRGIIAAVLLLLMLASLACHATGFWLVSSYDELQQAFSRGKTGVIYPDLSGLHFDESTIEYKTSYSLESMLEGKSRDTADIVNISICGDGILDDNPIHCYYSCHQDNTMYDPKESRLSYNGVYIEVHNDKLENACYDSLDIKLNGYNYLASVTYDIGRKLPEEDLEKLQAKVRDMLYAFICGIIDEAQETE